MESLRPVAITCASLLAAVLFAALAQPLVAALAGVEIAAGTAPSLALFLLAAITTEVGLLLVSAGLLRLYPGSVRFRMSGPDLVVAAMALLVLLAVNLATSWGMQWTGEDYSGLPPIPRGIGGLALVACAAGLAPAAEELLFREALLARVFATRPTILALLVTSLAFGVLHLSVGGPLLFLGITIMGFVLGLVRIVTGSLGAAILVHAAHNLCAMLLALASEVGA